MNKTNTFVGLKNKILKDIFLLLCCLIIVSCDKDESLDCQNADFETDCENLNISHIDIINLDSANSYDVYQDGDYYRSIGTK